MAGAAASKTIIRAKENQVAFEGSKTTLFEAYQEAQTDESIKKQCESLGLNTNMDPSAKSGKPVFVEICAIHIMSPQHPSKGFELKEKGRDKEGVMMYEGYQVAEGSELIFRVVFRVYNNTVM